MPRKIQSSSLPLRKELCEWTFLVGLPDGSRLQGGFSSCFRKKTHISYMFKGLLFVDVSYPSGQETNEVPLLETNIAAEGGIFCQEKKGLGRLIAS